VTSHLNRRLAVNDVMPHFLIWSQRFELVFNYVFLTITLEMCHKIALFPSQRLSTVTPVQCGNISFTHLITIFQLSTLKRKTNCCSMVTMISTKSTKSMLSRSHPILSLTPFYSAYCWLTGWKHAYS